MAARPADEPADPGESTAAFGIAKASGTSPFREERDWVAREEPLEIRVQGRSIAVTMRTPGHDFELAAGFLLSEGLIQKPEEIVEMDFCRNGENALLLNILNVFLAPGVRIDWEKLSRHVFASSSCGVCGKATVEAVRQQFPAILGRARFDRATLLGLADTVRREQTVFQRTGGSHAAALFDRRGEMLVLREDVGRHNAVDKAIGFALRRGMVPLDAHILFVSGRASFEIMQKALAARIPCVAAVSAPSSLAVEFARESGQTLAGFLRGDSFNLYANPDRIA